jgi:hypothetical protein
LAQAMISFYRVIDLHWHWRVAEDATTSMSN